MVKPAIRTTNRDTSDAVIDRPKCGLVMPISKSAKHSAEHWADVQVLLHRAITDAGFEPENVWEGDLTDRISKRIVGNLFSYEIIVVDASDSNPNVMLELGLRLASKKPTVVVSDSLADLPFDIRDLQAEPYPSDLNILGMEKFFSNLSRMLKAKYDAFKSNSYKPFLDDVVVEVVNPETREVSLDSAVLERLDDLTRRISRIDVRQRDRPASSTRSDSDPSSRISFTIPAEQLDPFTSIISDAGLFYSAHRTETDAYVMVRGNRFSERVMDRIIKAAFDAGGAPGMPREYFDQLS